MFAKESKILFLLHIDVDQRHTNQAKSYHCRRNTDGPAYHRQLRDKLN